MRLAMWSIKKKMYNCKIAEMRCVCPGSVPTTFSMVVNDSIIRIYPGLGDTKLKGNCVFQLHRTNAKYTLKRLKDASHIYTLLLGGSGGGSSSSASWNTSAGTFIA